MSREEIGQIRLEHDDECDDVTQRRIRYTTEKTDQHKTGNLSLTKIIKLVKYGYLKCTK